MQSIVSFHIADVQHTASLVPCLVSVWAPTTSALCVPDADGTPAAIRKKRRPLKAHAHRRSRLTGEGVAAAAREKIRPAGARTHGHGSPWRVKLSVAAEAGRARLGDADILTDATRSRGR